MTFDHQPLWQPSRNTAASLVRLPAGASWTIISTQTKFAGRHQHWVPAAGGGRTLPCLLPEHPCPYCETGKGKWYTAFLGCFCYSRKTSMVLAIPEEAYIDITAPVKDYLNGKLRGHRWQVSKPGSSRRNRWVVEYLGREEDEASIPPALHVPKILFRCWGLPAERYRVAAASAAQ